MTKVVGVALVVVGLALEGDGEVGAKDVAFHDESHEPFYDIYKVEGHDEKFQHLTSVDVLVMKVNGGEIHSLTHKDEAEEVDGCETSEGNKPINNHDTLYL